MTTSRQTTMQRMCNTGKLAISGINHANEACISGKVKEKWKLHYEIGTRKYFKAIVDVTRQSGAIDSIPIIASETLLKGNEDSEYILVKGTVNTRNNKNAAENESKLEVFVRAESIRKCCEEERNINELVIIGNICKKPVFRVTPLQKKICDVIVATNFCNGKVAYIPCIAWGKVAEIINVFMDKGSYIKLVGRLQSREYEKNGVTRQVYEVSIMKSWEE